MSPPLAVDNSSLLIWQTWAASVSQGVAWVSLRPVRRSALAWQACRTFVEHVSACAVLTRREP